MESVPPLFPAFSALPSLACLTRRSIGFCDDILHEEGRCGELMSRPSLAFVPRETKKERETNRKKHQSILRFLHRALLASPRALAHRSTAGHTDWRDCAEQNMRQSAMDKENIGCPCILDYKLEEAFTSENLLGVTDNQCGGTSTATSSIRIGIWPIEKQQNSLSNK